MFVSKYAQFILGLVPFAQPSCGEEVNAALESSACASCKELSLSLLECADENQCDYESCLEGDLEDILDSSCCPVCEEDFNAALDCFEDCLPECLYSTVVEYAACVEFRDCKDDCKSTFSEAAKNIESQVVTEAEDGSFEFDFSDVGDLGDFHNVSTPNITCSSVEEKFNDKVCNLANCCSGCIDQFELVAECIVNEVVFEMILGQNDTHCDVECGENDNVWEGWSAVREKVRGERLLQVPGDGPPGDGPPFAPNGGEPGDRPRFFALFDECRVVAAAYFVTNQPEGSFSGYLECLMKSVGEFSTTAASDSSTSTGVANNQGFLQSIFLFGVTVALQG